MWGSLLPTIILERFKLTQQIIYRRKGNLSQSPNQFKYRKNILISRFYEQFSRNILNLGNFALNFNPFVKIAYTGEGRGTPHHRRIFLFCKIVYILGYSRKYPTPSVDDIGNPVGNARWH